MKKLKIIAVLLTILIIGIAAAAVVFYTEYFSLALKGEEEMTVGLCSVYQDPGVEAVFAGKDVEHKVKIRGKVDTERPGVYELTYTLATLEVSRTVTVDTEMDPKLILQEQTEVDRIVLGEAFQDPGYEAYDRDGRDITADVTVSDTDFKHSGRHKVTYTVADAEGKMTQLTRTVVVAPNMEWDSPGLPICMYHYVYDENNPPDDLYDRYGNYISMQELEEELTWLNEEGYYYPTWEEVRDYIDGELLLPDKSIVLCFDDGAKSFLENGIPVLEKHKVPATCFMITSSNGKEKIAEYPSDYISYESHSHDMHRGGGYIGHGGIFTAISYEEGMDDLQTSIEICGSGDAFAYPYGDYNESSRQMVEDSGFLCAVTTQYGKAYPGDDPMLLPRVRMTMGQTLESFQYMVAPVVEEEMY